MQTAALTSQASSARVGASRRGSALAQRAAAPSPCRLALRSPLRKALAPPSAAGKGDMDVDIEARGDGATVFRFVEPEPEPIDPKLKALADDVAGLLKGVSVTLVGDSGELNAQLAMKLALLLEYAPVVTSSVVEQFTGQSIEKTLEEEGWNTVGAVEAVVMEQVSTNVRTVVSTLGGGGGAAARGDCWRHFFGHVCVWVEEVPAAGSTEVVEDKPQNDAYSQSEVQVKVVAGQDPAEAAEGAVQDVIGGLKALLQSEDDSPGMDLAGKKLLYIKLGVRGDWPDIMPPEWRPEGEE